MCPISEFNCAAMIRSIVTVQGSVPMENDIDLVRVEACNSPRITQQNSSVLRAPIESTLGLLYTHLEFDNLGKVSLYDAVMTTHAETVHKIVAQVIREYLQDGSSYVIQSTPTDCRIPGEAIIATPNYFSHTPRGCIWVDTDMIREIINASVLRYQDARDEEECSDNRKRFAELYKKLEIEANGSTSGSVGRPLDTRDPVVVVVLKILVEHTLGHLKLFKNSPIDCAKSYVEHGMVTLQYADKRRISQYVSVGVDTSARDSTRNLLLRR
ncbi:CUN032 putative odv-ec27 oclusion derived envelope protein, similar to AcMNPV ORF144 [Culex nigripalpus nucleopolyhedrovirus]|uniref:CUN032 putative odv-ec27 oclusion derived envelope protein, similar to AcMNPV ORF144 n=1 Tax=Culex nigripalpus nucleopolyhedrovirus (isolate Florida/1997) TaxID=645993 RepID=Q919N7_NPVCO|nr:CUN032 putative odv-ec27 oclusion derived envelope protein, similar to AcMNPV ORF144 [Culex nigripalpus nucleopolyhedrovirus]AAK94110.1 CUN032 putative odv-ec27 oclusion derived envelope protein, similar to AcMNPV ORF144 [Culex nigripalpus nucleopolyhedrovirus]